MLSSGIEHGVRSFLPDCEEARPCFARARALALERCKEPTTWSKLLGASDEEIEQVAERHGRNAAVIIVVEMAASGEGWAKQHVLQHVFRPAVMNRVAQVLAMDDEDCDFNVLAEEAVADASRYFETPKPLAKMAARARRQPEEPEQALKRYARRIAKWRAYTALKATRPVSWDELEKKAERGEGRSPEDMKDAESGLSSIDELRFKELVGLMDERITQLPPDQRRAIEAKLEHPDLSAEELAAMLGMTDVCFRQLVHRAREDLKEYLRQKLGIIVTKRRRGR